MKYGFVLPYGEARDCAKFAELAEKSGWDGFFVWEPVWGIDAWVCLTAAAMTTERIRLGTMLTPLSRCRPWKLASETATLDRLSGGRVILSIGLGAVDTGFEAFGEETDRRTRAELVDEGLEILAGLWKGQPFEFKGQHYQLQPTDFLPPPAPIQQPIPVWVVGAWPYPKSMGRALRHQGCIPYHPDMTPAMMGELVAWCSERCQSPLDIVYENHHGEAGLAERAAWEQAGVTWWLESLWQHQQSPDLQELIQTRLERGPLLDRYVD